MNTVQWNKWEKFQGAMATLESAEYLNSEEGSLARNLLDFQVNYQLGEISLEAVKSKSAASRWKEFCGSFTGGVRDQASIAAWGASMNSLTTFLREAHSKTPGAQAQVQTYSSKSVQKERSGSFKKLASQWEFANMYDVVLAATNMNGDSTSSHVFGTKVVTVNPSTPSVTATPFIVHRDEVVTYGIDELINISGNIVVLIAYYEIALNRINTSISAATGDDMDIDKYGESIRVDALKVRTMAVIIPLLIAEFDRIVTALMKETGD